MMEMEYDDYDDVTNELLSKFELPPELDEKRIVLQILDSSGNIEDILIDINDIYKYVKDVYKKCPKRS